MRFLKRLFKRRHRRSDTGPSVSLPESIPESPEALFAAVKAIQQAGLPPEQARQKVRYFITSLPDWLIRDTYKKLIADYWHPTQQDDPPEPATRHLVAFRLSLYNPEYRNSRDPALGKLLMTLINLAPELLKSGAGTSSDMDAAMTTSEELDQLIADLSIFNLSESELKYTVTKILEYNRHNVAYTDDEVIVLNNSELLRVFLDRFSVILQDFVQQAAMWQRYFDPTVIGIPPIQQRILNLHFREYFPTRREDAITLFRQAPSISELERTVPLKLRPLFQRDTRFLVGRIRNRILEENDQLLLDIRTNLCWHLQLLHELRELPSRNIMISLMDKAMRFHHQYYPDLVKAVQPELTRVMAEIGDGYRNIAVLKSRYPVELTRGMKEHSRQYHGATISFDRFLETIREQTTHVMTEQIPSNTLASDYQPEELNILRTNPDAEVAILTMNEKLALAEEREPILDHPYFFKTRKDYLKVVLLETLQSVMTASTPFKIAQSLLLKSLDRSRRQCAPIMENMISRLKEDGFHPQVVRKLLKKQKQRHHLTTIIRDLLTRQSQWAWLTETGTPDIRLEKFSTVTGHAFFSVTTSRGRFKITARYENGQWRITHVSPDSGKTGRS